VSPPFGITFYIIAMARIEIGNKTIITSQAYNPMLYANIIEKYSVSALVTSPVANSVLLDYVHTYNCKEKLKSLKKILFGGSKMTMKMQLKTKDILPEIGFSIGYGMTELANISSKLSEFNGISDCVGNLTNNMQGKV
jgi:acyl-coenzyme A synthetase/AMP-(fatty) acid ligase